MSKQFLHGCATIKDVVMLKCWGRLKETSLKPELRHKDVNIDDVPVRNHSVGDVVHGQLQHGAQRTNQWLHLPDHTHNHAVIQTLNDVKGIVDVPVQNVVDDIRGFHVREM